MVRHVALLALLLALLVPAPAFAGFKLLQAYSGPTSNHGFGPYNFVNTRFKAPKAFRVKVTSKPSFLPLRRISRFRLTCSGGVRRAARVHQLSGRTPVVKYFRPPVARPRVCNVHLRGAVPGPTRFVRVAIYGRHR